MNKPRFIKRKDDGYIFYLGKDELYHLEKNWETGDSITKWSLDKFSPEYFEFFDKCEKIIKYQDGFPPYID